MEKAFYDKVMESVDYIKSVVEFEGKVGIVLGSGLGGLVDMMEEKVKVNYEDIPNFPLSTVSGHGNCLVFGKVNNTAVMCMKGRFHFYEGYTMKEVTYPIYVMKKLGIDNVIITNSCGGINTDFSPGTLMIIDEFINLVTVNPLFGPNDERFGPRFPDMSEPYTLSLIEKAKEIADREKIDYGQGVYAGFMGPYYETKAEIRAFKTMGADAIGMSTVPETIVSNYLGMKTLGIACITNMATGIQKEKHSHANVVKTAQRSSETFCKWLGMIVDEVKW